MNVLLGVTGSIAATLTHKLQDTLEAGGHEFKTIVTNSAIKIGLDCKWRQFLTDEHEWEAYRNKKTVLHIDLIKWADIFIVAPCTANTLAKMANGISDNLLTSCALAWNYEKPFVFAPSMNCLMYQHPATLKNIFTMESFGAVCVKPQVKKLFCGDIGIGAMADISDIFKEIKQ